MSFLSVIKKEKRLIVNARPTRSHSFLDDQARARARVSTTFSPLLYSSKRLHSFLISHFSSSSRSARCPPTKYPLLSQNYLRVYDPSVRLFNAPMNLKPRTLLYLIGVRASPLLGCGAIIYFLFFF